MICFKSPLGHTPLARTMKPISRASVVAERLIRQRIPAARAIKNKSRHRLALIYAQFLIFVCLGLLLKRAPAYLASELRPSAPSGVFLAFSTVFLPTSYYKIISPAFSTLVYCVSPNRFTRFLALIFVLLSSSCGGPAFYAIYSPPGRCVKCFSTHLALFFAVVSFHLPALTRIA